MFTLNNDWTEILTCVCNLPIGYISYEGLDCLRIKFTCNSIMNTRNWKGKITRSFSHSKCRENGYSTSYLSDKYRWTIPITEEQFQELKSHANN